MKVLSILLALVNSLMAGLVLLSCISVSNLGWDGLGWLSARVTTWVIVILARILTFCDGGHPIGLGKKLITGLMLILLASACASTTPQLTSTPEPATAIATFPSTPTATSTPLPTDTPTDTPTPIPTYAVLRGEVTVDHLGCRYGPGWPYLYFTGLREGNRIEIIGRIEDAKWIYVQDIGGEYMFSVQKCQVSNFLKREYKRMTDPDNLRFARRLRKHRPHLLRFLYVEGLDATNNLAERQLRPAVITRKTSGCNRTDDGAETHAILSSVLVTCRQQKRPILDYLVELQRSHGIPSPLLASP